MVCSFSNSSNGNLHVISQMQSNEKYNFFNFSPLYLIPGAFLIPFTLMLITAGLPLMFMELSFGQYSALGPIAIYRRFCPLMRGLGYGMIIVSAVVMLYYNVILAWAIFYMLQSIGSDLPWRGCEQPWSTQCKYSFLFIQQKN